MTKARREGRKLRASLGVEGAADVDQIAEGLGLRVDTWDLPDAYEVKIGDSIAVASRLGVWWRRWAIAHAIGHHILHPGNYLYLRAHTMLVVKDEREAEDFAYGLLVDPWEANEHGLITPEELAEFFGVPEETL